MARLAAPSVLSLLAIIPLTAGNQRYTAAAEADRVDRVPFQPNVSFAQFAGFVNISDSSTRRVIFYWFVESERAPETAPLLLWTNGGGLWAHRALFSALDCPCLLPQTYSTVRACAGPGCSGLLGKLTEMGPFRAARNGTALDRLAYAWNRGAHHPPRARRLPAVAITV